MNFRVEVILVLLDVKWEVIGELNQKGELIFFKDVLKGSFFFFLYRLSTIIRS